MKAAFVIIQNTQLMMRRQRQMEPEQAQIDLTAEIKADVFSQILDNMTKNMKDNEKIFFIFNQKQMKIWLRQTSKTTQLQLKIDSKLFASYDCRRTNDYIYRKYQLKKFLYFQTYFESCKGLIKIKITQQQIKFLDNGTNSRMSIFPVRGEDTTSQEQQDLENIDLFSGRKQQDFCELYFPKAKLIQQVIHSGNTMKSDKLLLSYIANQKKLKFEFKKQDSCYLKVKVQETLSKGNKISKVPFTFKKLKLAMGLLESQKPFKVRFSQNHLLINFDEQNKKNYHVCLLSQREQNYDS